MSAVLYEDKIGRLVVICGQLTDCLGLRLGFVATWSSRDHHMIIWTIQSLADVLRLYLCVYVKLIHVDRSERKISMPLNLYTGVRVTKTEPIAEQWAILPPLYLWINVALTTSVSGSSPKGNNYALSNKNGGGKSDMSRRCERAGWLNRSVTQVSTTL